MRSFSIQSICLYIIILFIPNILLSQEVCNTYFLKDLSFKSIIEPQFTLVTKQNEVLSCGNIKYGPIYNSFISKFSENGDLLWNYQLVNTKNETLSGGVEISNNNFIVYGNIENKIILHKINNLGRIIWSKEVSTPNSIKDSLTKLIVNKDGTIFGCLNSKTDTEKSLPVIIKIDVDGNTLWTKMLMQNESALVNTVADDYPNILVGGSRIIDKTRTPFVAQIDNSGNLIESKNIRLTSLVDHYNSNIESEITEIIVKDTSIAYLFHYLSNICIAEFTKADDRLIFEFTLGSSSSQSFSSLKYYDNNFYLYSFSDNNSQLNKISIFSNIVYRLTSIKDESNNSNFKGFDIAKNGNIFITSYTKFVQIYDNIYLYKINKDLESDCFYPSLFFINETRKYDLSINNWDSFNNTQILLTNATYNAVVHNATSKTLCESSNCIKKNIIQEECNETFITEFSSNKLSELMDAANTKDGGFIAVGSSSSNGLIAKIKHNGDIGSAKLVDSLLYGTIYNFIVPSANNSYIISGTSDLSYNHRGSKHARLLRINESTEIINKLSIVGVQIDGIAPTKDGGVIVIFNRNIGSSPVYNYVVKFDIQFNVVWKKELKNLDGKVNKITFENNELYIGYESLRLMGMVYCGTIRLNPENGNVIWSRQFNFGYDMYDNGAVNNNLFSDDNYVYFFLLRHNKLHLYNPSFSTLMLKLSKADGSLVDSKEIITYNNTLPQVARNDLFRGNVTKAYPSGFLLSYSAKLPTGDTALMVKKLKQNGEFEWIKYYTLKSITVNNIRQVGKGYVISGSWNRENDKIRYPLYKNMTLIKIDSLGNISNNNIANCQTITGIASYGNYTPDQSNNSIESDELYMDLEFSNIKLVELDIPLKVNQYCHKKSTCNEIEVVDTESICSMNQEAIFYLDKNCAAAKWKYDTAYFEKIVESHDTLRLKPLKSGIGKVEVLATNACETISKEFQVRILTNANDLDLGSDKILCNELDKAVLNAGSFYKDVIWSTGETTPEITVSKPDKYIVTVSDFCGNTATKEISILKNLNTLKIIGEKEKCFNDTINLKLETNNYQNIIWSPDNKYIKVDDSEIQTYTDKNIKYIVSATDQNNCELKDSIMIEVKAIIPLNIGNDTTICPNESIILEVNNNGFMSYEWNTGETTSQINAKEPMSYLAHATHTNGCTYSDTLKLSNFQFIAPNLGNDTSICSNSSLELSPGIFKAYQWNSSDYSSSKYTIKNAGKYWVDVVDFNGCKASDSIVVLSIIDAPSNFLKKQDSICNFETLDISSLKTFNTYNWSNGSTSKTINISKPGLYYLNVKADNGCYAKDSINVTMATNCNNGIHVPNAFTPNNDGKNDLFKPLIFEKLLYYEFTIFNRWGQIVFRSLNTNIGWDGKYNGVNQESNTYIWQLNYQIENNNPSQKKGTVLLFR